ncbi:MAG: lipoprotein LpqH, partial [Mycobacterium sp.]
GSETATSSTASVTVNGNDSRIHTVKCSQLEWYRTIDVGGDLAGVTAVVDERAQPFTAISVRIKNVGGFTGLYSQGGNGDAKMSLSGDKYQISGTANGYKVDTNQPATAAFKISASC